MVSAGGCCRRKSFDGVTSAGHGRSLFWVGALLRALGRSWGLPGRECPLPLRVEWAFFVEAAGGEDGVLACVLHVWVVEAVV